MQTSIGEEGRSDMKAFGCLAALALLVVIVLVVHFVWINGTDLAMAKLGEPQASVISNASELITHGKASEGVPLLEYESGQGNRYAQLLLASFYEQGKYLPKDSQKALSLYKQLADAGYNVAANEIGIMYYCGQLGSRDEVIARQWFARAAATGSKPALKNQQLLDEKHTMRCPEH
jgi:TPR repeat protein